MARRRGIPAPLGVNPAFAEHGPASVFAAPGDAYLIHSQVWHRGAQNTSVRMRFPATTDYARRFVAQHFYPFLNYRMPDHVIAGAGEKLLRLLGRHPKGPYG